MSISASNLSVGVRAVGLGFPQSNILVRTMAAIDLIRLLERLLEIKWKVPPSH